MVRAAVSMFVAMAVLASWPKSYALAAGRDAAMSAAAPAAPYADIADLADGAAVIVRARVRAVTPIPPERSPGLLPGQGRYLAQADVITLIRGDDAVARRIGFLFDAPRPARGVPAWKKRDLLLFGRAVPGHIDQIQLRGRASVLDWSAATEALLRAIVTDLLRPGAPPRVTRVASAFHVAGTVAGESETQIFLDTASDRPISLSVVRRPGEEPLLGVALGEVVDEAAGRPAPGTLLWYRLACFLPPALPDAVRGGMSDADAAAADGDYQLVLASLGPCARSAGAR